MIASVSSAGKAGTVSGKYPHSKGTGTPAISQWPVIVSLPIETSSAEPWKLPASKAASRQRVRSGGDAGRVAKPERRHNRQGKRSAAQPVLIRAPFCRGARDMAQRVRTGIAEARAVGRAANAEGIEDEQESA